MIKLHHTQDNVYMIIKSKFRIMDGKRNDGIWYEKVYFEVMNIWEPSRKEWMNAQEEEEGWLERKKMVIYRDNRRKEL